MPSSMDVNDSNIANLPSDVIRMIIEIGLESFEGLRMISHRWNSLALEHLAHREKLPVIKSMCWHSDEDGFLNPIVQVANKYRNYFGLKYWRATSTALDHELEIYHGRLANDPAKMVWFGQRFARLVERSSFVERLQFKGLQNENINFDFVKEVLADANVRELSFAYHFKSISSIIKFLRLLSSVRCVNISFDIVQFVHAMKDDNFPAILREIVQMTESLEFTLISTLIDASPHIARLHMMNIVVLFNFKTGINVNFHNMEQQGRKVTLHLKATKIEE